MSILELIALKCEPVDINVLTSLADGQEDGEPDLVVELIELYLLDTTRRIAALQEALAVSDWQSLSKVAHGLKGSSSTVGAAQVADTCEELERLASAVVGEKISTVVERLEKEFAIVHNIFLAEREKRSGLTNMAA
jgi:HPt (histidine-containing phosphotransfer) domain-containing protein